MDFLDAKLENIVMVNYPVPHDFLSSFLPKGCELDLYKGIAYISLVGFMFKNIRLFKIPIPLLGTFEEINLRFYVLRREGDQLKRGVVFINETIPYKAVAWVANKLYKEHYTTIPTKNFISINTTQKKIEYLWQNNNLWNSIYVESSTDKIAMQPDSFEEFIFEHYYGYTKIDNFKTKEYKTHHPRWHINKIKNHKVDCDFSKMFGSGFSFLNSVQPHSVLIAEGSAISVKWKRNLLK